MNAIATRLGLATAQVDLAIRAGRMATRTNSELSWLLRATVMGETVLAPPAASPPHATGWA